MQQKITDSARVTGGRPNARLVRALHEGRERFSYQFVVPGPASKDRVFMLTAVMYHYVRPDSPTSRFRLHVRTIEEFETQLDHIGRRFEVVHPSRVLAAAQGRADLPPNACLLTFDDGLLDHFAHVTPRLVDRGWSGLFFVTADPVLRRTALDVHKVHFILAAAPEPDRLADEVLRLAAPFRAEHRFPSDAELRATYGTPNRFDGAAVNLCKRLLQRALPVPVRSAIVADLFRRLVTMDERAFVDELYLDRRHLEGMRQAGMVIGGHAASHEWLDTLTPDRLAEELRASGDLVRSVHGPDAAWAFSYPYGEVVRAAFPEMQRLGCVAAFSTRTASGPDDWPFQIPRLDTNDLPVHRSTPSLSALV